MRGQLMSPESDASRRHAIREVAREHHPDVGGDPDVYLEKMRELDERFASSVRPSGSDGRRWRIRLGRRMRRGRRRVGKRARRARNRLPKGVPGSRRYFDV